MDEIDKKSALKLTKIAVAQREIDAAVKMLFLEMDEIAIYCVAGAALKMLQELHRRREKDPMQDALSSGLVTVLNKHLNGTKFDEQMDHVAKTLAASLTDEQRQLLKSSRFREVTVNGLKAGADKLWSQLIAPYNFLKHANRDAGNLLDAEDLDIEPLLATCCAAYVSLGLPPTKAMKVFHYYWFYKSPLSEHVLEVGAIEFELAIKSLNELRPEEVKPACLALIDADLD